MLLAGLALAVLCGIVFGWLGEEMLENDTVRFDSRVRGIVHEQSEAPLTSVMILATEIGSTVPVLAFTMLAVMVFWLRKMRWEAITLGLAILGAGALSYVLKLGFHRPRPAPYFGLPVPNTFSFPSGHSLIALCLYVLLAHLVCSHVRSGAIRTGIWTLAIIMVLLIGFSRVYLGVHYASDVIAGYAAGVVWVVTIVFAEPFVWSGKSSR